MSFLSVNRVPTGHRVPALQQTAHACVAAAIADAVGELIGLSYNETLGLQWDLIHLLGGLRTGGARLELAAAAIARLVPSLGVAVRALPLDEAVAAASTGAGVVVGLANPGGGEGHAVRIEAGEGVLAFDAGDEWINEYLARDRTAISDHFECYVFDPWPEGKVLYSTAIAGLRPRYERFGGRVLIITRGLVHHRQVRSPGWNARFGCDIGPAVA